MKVIIEVLAAPAMLSETCHAWMAFAIMTDATEVASSHIGEEDVGTEVDGLGRPFEPPASARKFAQIHRTVDRDEYISVFRNRLACHQRAHEGNTQDARTSACSAHEGPYGEKQLPARFGNRGPRAVGWLVAHLS
jgi:hypothetical protein